MKKMSEEDREKLYKIKLYSREGGTLFPDQLEYIRMMFENYSKEFEEIDKQIRIETIRKLNPLYDVEE